MDGVILGWGSVVVLMVAGYLVGRAQESGHYRVIESREHEYRSMPVTTFETLPEDWVPVDSELVMGSVVVSTDYFKRFVAGLRMLFGGRIKAYEPLLDRARRESILRMIEQARDQGFNAIINVRIETSRLASSRADGKGTAGIEILAYGTALNI